MKGVFRRHLAPVRGQAMVEAALVLVPLVFLALLGVNVLVLHRVRTAATAAAYACAQYVTQFPHRPERAAEAGAAAAGRILSAPWSATRTARFAFDVTPPGGPGETGRCTVHYSVRLPFAPSGLGGVQGSISITGAGERWQGRW